MRCDAFAWLLCTWVILEPFQSSEKPGTFWYIWQSLTNRNTWVMARVYDNEAVCRSEETRRHQTASVRLKEALEKKTRWSIEEASDHSAMIRSRCVPTDLLDQLGVRLRPGIAVFKNR